MCLRDFFSRVGKTCKRWRSKNSNLGRHLSKSTSELTRNKVEPTRKTEDSSPSFFASLKERWVKSRERIGKPGKKEVVDTDYAADNSASEHSASVTPLTQSPRKYPISTVSGSPKPLKGFENKVILTGDVNAYDEALLRRESSLRKYSFFQLRIHLIRGKDLISCDKNGTSDPYVKFKVGGRLLFKSKTIYKDLNPVWDETSTLPIEDPLNPINIKVFDYDWGLQDDFMGSALLDLRELDLGKLTDLHLTLKDPAKPDVYLGEIHLTATLWPKSQEEKEQYFQRNAKLADVNKRLKSQIWSSVVTIILVEGKDLIKIGEDTHCDQYVKFRLGQEKYKSKVSNKPSNPQWFEQFDFHLYDDQSQDLEITVWKSKLMMIDDLIGRCSINLSELEREKTHRIKKDLEDGQGEIFLLLTISGTTASETISDLTSYDDTYEKIVVSERYTLSKTFHNLKDIGHLTVKVYKAQGLTSADIGGKSDPFCVLELINARLQTHTEYKTLCPSWQKIFTFTVKDINSVLEVTVYDEDRDHKVEFLGKVAIPLLRIRNNEKHWYSLKDKKLYGRAKGNNPQILLELSVIWNPVRACIRTLNPKEDKYMKSEIKFKRQVFLRNVMRLKVIILWFIDLSKFINDCFEWESTSQSIAALIAFVLLCYYFEPYMAPMALLLIFLKFYIVKAVSGVWSYSDEDVESIADDDDEEEDKDKEEKKSLKERLQTIQEVTQSVQNAIGYIASLGESVKNTFNFTVPFLSYLAIILLVAVTVVLHFIPVRYLILAWGVNKFARKLLRPLSVPNNEILDLLSRVPNDDDLVCYRELRTNNPLEVERRRDQRKIKKNV